MGDVINLAEARQKRDEKLATQVKEITEEELVREIARERLKDLILQYTAKNLSDQFLRESDEEGDKDE